MAWLHIELSEAEQRVVSAERENPAKHVRRKMLVLWSLHCGLKREQAAWVAEVGLATVERYVAAYRDGGLDGLRQWNVHGPVSELAAYRDVIQAAFEQQPATTVAEACDRIHRLTGLRRGPTQVRQFLKALGMKWQRIRAIPVPPKKTWPSTSMTKPCFTTPN